MHEGDPARPVRTLEYLLEQRVLGAVGGGARVREVGRDRRQVPLQGDLSAQRELARRVHTALLRALLGNPRANSPCRSRGRRNGRAGGVRRQSLPGKVAALPIRGAGATIR